MISDALAFSIQSLFVKWAGQRIPSQQTLFVRSLSMLVLNLEAAAARGGCTRSGTGAACSSCADSTGTAGSRALTT
jgi:hypothetical protein